MVGKNRVHAGSGNLGDAGKTSIQEHPVNLVKYGNVSFGIKYQ